MPKITKFKNKTQSFIETGSYMRDGIQLAIHSEMNGFLFLYIVYDNEEL